MLRTVDSPTVPAENGRTRATVLGFALAVALLSVLVYLAGTDEVVAALLAADAVVIGGLAVVVGCWIAVWGASLRLVLRAFDQPAPPARTYLAYATMMFWDNVTPFSTVAADPLAAGVLSRAFDVEYERSLAVVVTVDFFNFVPSPFFAAVGLLIVGSSAVAGGVIGRIAGPLLAVLVAASVGSVLAWRHRRRLAAAAATVLGRLERTVRRLVPGLDRRTDLEFRRRATTLLDQLETVAARRRTLAALLLCGVTGWALLSLGLWLSLYAVGVVVPLGVTLFAVPLVTVIELIPLPGGVGGLEPLLVLLLAATTGAPLATVTAGVLVFRLGTHVLPTALGGAAHPLLVYR